MKKYLAISMILLSFLAVGCLKSKKANNYSSNNYIENRREVLKTAVHVTAEGLSNIALDSKGNIDTALVKKFITNVHFLNDNSGCFFVNDYTNDRIIINPSDTALVGKTGTNIKDAKGNYYFRLMSQKAKSGGGFVDYFAINPKQNKEQLKETYVEKILNTNFYLGAGRFISVGDYSN